MAESHFEREFRQWASTGTPWRGRHGADGSIPYSPTSGDFTWALFASASVRTVSAHSTSATTDSEDQDSEAQSSEAQDSEE